MPTLSAPELTQRNNLAEKLRTRYKLDVSAQLLPTEGAHVALHDQTLRGTIGVLFENKEAPIPYFFPDEGSTPTGGRTRDEMIDLLKRIQKGLPSESGYEDTMVSGVLPDLRAAPSMNGTVFKGRFKEFPKPMEVIHIEQDKSEMVIRLPMLVGDALFDPVAEAVEIARLAHQPNLELPENYQMSVPFAMGPAQLMPCYPGQGTLDFDLFAHVGKQIPGYKPQMREFELSLKTERFGNVIIDPIEPNAVSRLKLLDTTAALRQVLAAK